MKKTKNIVFIILIVIVTTFINYLVYNKYYNNKILDIVTQIEEEHKEINKSELAEIIKNPKDTDNNILKNYGYNENDLFLVDDIKNSLIFNITINLIILLTVFLTLRFIKNNNRNKTLNEINELFNLLYKINNGNYDIELNEFSENEFSKLRSEIYKTIGLLKEQTEYLKAEKTNLKNNLADISHQIRTPLTSISLMLEAIIEDKEMENDKKSEFINIIYKQTDKINYLIESLLKLSKFDASVIQFKQEKVNVCDMLKQVKCSLNYMLEEKNIKLNISSNKKIIIKCDKKWQEEALTNVIKNSIEYSNNNSNLDITVTNNNFYTLLSIKDYGSGINKKDLKKIFDRFHKSQNSNGFGIGLNLAKTIIEKDNGIISVESEEGKYTIFNIKYFKQN